MTNRTSTLFVCMGNICRSPSAEGFFRRHVSQAGLTDSLSIDSAGTHGYHVGHAPDHRAIAEALKFDVDIAALRARRVDTSDFQRFDYMIAMDHDNLRLLEHVAPRNPRARLSLMMDFAGPGEPAEVPDPYYGSTADFVYMCELLEHATAGLLAHIRAEIDAG